MSLHLAETLKKVITYIDFHCMFVNVYYQADLVTKEAAMQTSLRSKNPP
jgi:hypothetical protein